MPSPTGLKAQIRTRIDAFAEELSSLVRQAAFESLQEAMGVPTVRRHGPGRPRGSTRKKVRGRRGRPPSAATEALMPKVLAQVKAKDGQGVSDIARALRVDVQRVKPVMAKLLASKQIKKTGQKRGTKYHVAGGGNGEAVAKVPARKKPEQKRSRKAGRRKAAN